MSLFTADIPSIMLTQSPEEEILQLKRTLSRWAENLDLLLNGNTDTTQADIEALRNAADQMQEEIYAVNKKAEKPNVTVGSEHRPVYFDDGVPTQCGISTTFYQLTSHASGDFDDFTEPGIHYVNGAASGFQHAPYSSGSFYAYLTVKASTSKGTITQEFQTVTSNHRFYRAKANGAWSAWEEISSYEAGSNTSGWTWKKYEDGTFDAWYESTVTADCTTQRGGLYMPATRISRSLPFTIKTANVTGSVGVGTNTYMYWLAELYHSTTTIYFMPICTTSRSADITVNLQIHGTY